MAGLTYQGAFSKIKFGPLPYQKFLKFKKLEPDNVGILAAKTNCMPCFHLLVLIFAVLKQANFKDCSPPTPLTCIFR